MEMTRRNLIGAGIAAAGAGIMGAAGLRAAGAEEAKGSSPEPTLAESQAEAAREVLKDTLQFHSICLICKDLESYLEFWTDFMGCKAMGITEFPSSEEDLAKGTGMSPELCEDIFDHEGHALRVAFVMCQGCAIELNSPVDVELTPADQLMYRNTGMRELGFNVDDIDYWYKKVQDAGYYITTPEPWSTMGGSNPTFIFADPEGNLIQLTQTDTFEKYWDFLASTIA